MSARLHIDLDAFARNLRVIRETVAPATHMLVVKDDAYGHGRVPIVQRAAEEGVSWFGAFDVATGVAVREALGPGARIFVWILGSAADVRAAVDADLDIGVGDAVVLQDVVDLRANARVHLKIDTGLHRNGIRAEDWTGVVARAVEAHRAGALRLEGVWSHLAEASDDEDDAARAAFQRAREVAAAAGAPRVLAHFAASAASFARPEFRDDLVRVGAFAYGIRPAGGPGEDELGITPIASLVADVRDVDGNHAHVACGSLDGIPSSLGGLISVRTPAGIRRVVAVEPDRLVVEGWTTMRPGQTVTVLGAGAPHSLTDAAERIGTIGEEIAVRISPGIDRVYRPEIRPTR